MLRRKMYDVLLDWKSRSQGRTALLVEGARRVGKSTVDLGKFKLYLADTGLFVALAFKDADFTDNIVYGKLLSDKLPVNLGMVYENVVAQELTAHGRRLFYHTWPKPGTTRNYEIDFIVPDSKKVSPVEVKSSNYRTHASLDAFCEKCSSRVGRRYLVLHQGPGRGRRPSTASRPTCPCSCRERHGDGGPDRRDDARGTVHRLQVSESWPTNPMMAIGKGFPRYEHTTRRFIENKRRHAILKGALFSRKEIQHDDPSRNYCRKPQHGLANHPHHLGDAKLTRY